MAVATKNETVTATIDRESTTKAETDLLSRMARAATRDHWKFGEWASEWTQQYSRGRTDADLAKAVNAQDEDADVSRQYVSIARRVWQLFGATEQVVEGLTFSHHAIALESIGVDKEDLSGSRREAIAWLKKAQTKGWTTTDLRRQIVSSLQKEGEPADDALPENRVRDVETDDEPTAETGGAVEQKPRVTNRGTPDAPLPIEQITGLFDTFIAEFETAFSELTDDADTDKKRLMALKTMATKVISTMQDHLKAIECLLS